MNRTEVAQVLYKMNAAWSGVELADETILTWAQHINHVDPQVALQAADRAIAAEDRFPSIAKFLGYCKAVKGPAEYVPELPTGVAEPDEVAAALAAARSNLAAGRSAVGGPECAAVGPMSLAEYVRRTDECECFVHSERCDEGGERVEVLAEAREAIKRTKGKR